MNQQNMNISELSARSGINRASLTQLINNESKMVKFETLDRLINVLEVMDVDELFEITASGSIIFSGYKMINQTTFTTTIHVTFEPVRGAERIDTDIEYGMTLRKIDEHVFLLQGVPVDNISRHVDNVFTWLTRLDISNFLNQFISELFGAEYIRSTSMPKRKSVFSLELISDVFKETESQLLLSFGELPMLSAVASTLLMQNEFYFRIYPDEADLYTNNKSDEQERVHSNSVHLISRLLE